MADSIFSDGHKCSEDEKRYRRLIDESAEKKLDRRISNSESEHAVYLLYKLLGAAENNVLIHTGRLSREFKGFKAYSDPTIIEKVLSFLRNEGTRVEIITDDDLDVADGEGPVDHPMLKAIAEETQMRGELKLYRAPDGLRERFKYHLVVVDNQATRVEYDPDAGKAFVNFGNGSLASTVVEAFRIIRGRSEEVLRLPKAA